MKHDNNCYTIYKLRQKILSDIRNYAAQLIERNKGTFNMNMVMPIVTYRNYEQITNARVITLIFNETTITEFVLEDVYNYAIYHCSSDNLYVEGLNEILYAVMVCKKHEHL